MYRIKNQRTKKLGFFSVCELWRTKAGLKIIGRYAIGGAIAATRYIEPVQTFDLDIFVIFPLSESGLISISPVYDYLAQLGYTAEGEFVNIEGWPVQLLPVYNPLTEEAMEKVIEVEFGKTPTRVFSAEYLAAIMIETGRPKDHARLIHFFEFDSVDRSVLEDIVTRHGLKEKWRKFQEYYLKKDG
ncbi:MAG: hypothetical protein DRI57_04230 [Deltaproteobacteria bacterium]|nr:MAG: hypothetical protein DRI57_04230 [Deltaproteobacteria bacterium]